MGLTRYEMETEVLFNREEDSAVLYTADSVWMNKMDKLVQQNGTDFKLIEEVKHDGKVIAKTYEFPKRLVTIRSKAVKPNLTDEQREAMRERGRKLRAQQMEVEQ